MPVLASQEQDREGAMVLDSCNLLSDNNRMLRKRISDYVSEYPKKVGTKALW